MKNIYKSDICVRCKRELRKQKKIIKQRENVIKSNAKGEKWITTKYLSRKYENMSAPRKIAFEENK